MRTMEGDSIYETPKVNVVLNSEGLSPKELRALKHVAIQLFEGATNKFRYALDRCTFFAEPGYEVLAEITSTNPLLTNPRIEGCDSNPFNQHYWVGADLMQGEEKRAVIF